MKALFFALCYLFKFFQYCRHDSKQIVKKDNLVILASYWKTSDSPHVEGNVTCHRVSAFVMVHQPLYTHTDTSENYPVFLQFANIDKFATKEFVAIFTLEFRLFTKDPFYGCLGTLSHANRLPAPPKFTSSPKVKSLINTN